MMTLLLVACNFMSVDWNDTSEHGKSFEDDGQTVYNGSLLILNDFLVFCLYLFICITLPQLTLEIPLATVSSFLRTNFMYLSSNLIPDTRLQ